MILTKTIGTLTVGTLFLLTACGGVEYDSGKTYPLDTGMVDSLDREDARAILEQHLDAVSTRDLALLSTTLSKEADMRLSLPGTETTFKTSEFMDFHRAWFQDTTWTFETEIIRIDAGERFAHALVESVYREPLRDGRPYFNHMTISYVLRKENGQWVVIADHASSIEKSTDLKE